MKCSVFDENDNATTYLQKDHTACSVVISEQHGGNSHCPLFAFNFEEQVVPSVLLFLLLYATHGCE